MIRRQPELKKQPFVLAAPDHGLMRITAANILALQNGVHIGQVLADARAINQGLQYFDNETARDEKLLSGLAEWCIRYSPKVAIDMPDGITIDASGCAHLWGREENYLDIIHKRLDGFGYHNRIAIADTIGAAWAVARFDHKNRIVYRGTQAKALLNIPAAALRLENDQVERLEKLGLHHIGQFMNMPRAALRRRFGTQLLRKLNCAMGNEEEHFLPLYPQEPFQERLPCVEPIVSATGISIGLERLLTAMCSRLKQEEKGLRSAILKCFRLDGKMISIQIETTRPSHNSKHIFKLFEEKIGDIMPEPGIELFTLDAPVTEPLSPVQEKMFGENVGLNDSGLGELLDRIAGKFGENLIQRFLPAAHYWPERSYTKARELHEHPKTEWKVCRPRPVQLLVNPAYIVVAAPVPDYPPMNFRYQNKLHKIIKADGPERIEQEWWLQDGLHRDYYVVEDEEGKRYWLFRLGHYDVERSFKWFLHGFFA